MSMLPDELLLCLNEQIPYRDLQIRQLAALLGSAVPSPSTLLVHGVGATGKTLTVEAILDAIQIPSAIIRSQECITTRHLLERTIASINGKLGRQKEDEVDTSGSARCESISAFVVELQQLLEERGKFILVFDGVDRQRDAAPTLLPVIARLGETIPNLTTILMTTLSYTHLLHHSPLPHIRFPPYTRAETLSIISKTPCSLYTSILSSPFSDAATQANTQHEDSVWLWTRFTAAVWDSLGQSYARDIVSFREVCARFWPSFVQPILDGHYGAREFSKLMVKNRVLFQSEATLIDSIVPITPNTNASKPNSHTLPYYPTHLLISAYLASHTPPRLDIPLFSQTSLSKRRKRGGGTALGRPSKHRKISRKLLGPQPFPLERLLAIFHAILPHEMNGGGADVMCMFATLVGLRLVVKAGGGPGDVLEGGGKWRCNVGWEFVRGAARGVKFDLESFVME